MKKKETVVSEVEMVNKTKVVITVAIKRSMKAEFKKEIREQSIANAKTIMSAVETGRSDYPKDREAIDQREIKSYHCDHRATKAQ